METWSDSICRRGLSRSINVLFLYCPSQHAILAYIDKLFILILIPKQNIAMLLSSSFLHFFNHIIKRIKIVLIRPLPLRIVKVSLFVYLFCAENVFLWWPLRSIIFMFLNFSYIDLVWITFEAFYTQWYCVCCKLKCVCIQIIIDCYCIEDVRNIL